MLLKEIRLLWRDFQVRNYRMRAEHLARPSRFCGNRASDRLSSVCQHYRVFRTIRIHDRSALALGAMPRRDGRDLLPADPEPAGDFELRHRRAVADGLGYPALELQALCLELLP